MREDVLSFDEAWACVAREAARVQPPRAEQCALADALGRVLAEPVLADRDMPPFARSTRDGFAVQAAALSAGPLHVVGSVAAGQAWEGPPLREQDAVEIMTGAPVPPGTDAVVMLEHVTAVGGTVKLQQGRSVAAGTNIVPAGAEAKAGEVLLGSGARLSAAAVGLTAAAGKSALEVFRRPKVAIVSTGDELVEVEQLPGPAQIRNSNAYSLAALVRQSGGEPMLPPIACDSEESLRASIAAALPCDLLILSGGVSAGKFDLVEPVLTQHFGATFFFTGVRMQPGKPVVFGRLGASCGDTWLLALPGNPISAMVTFSLFAAPLLAALCGVGEFEPPFTSARLDGEIEASPELTRFLPGHVTWRENEPWFQRLPWQGSGDMRTAGRANAHVRVPAGAEGLHQGEWVTLLRGI